MSATRTDMHGFIEALAQRVPRQLHPLAQQSVHQCFTLMHEAADCGDHAEVIRLLRLAHAKIADELRWEAVKHATGHDFKHAHRLRRQAERIEARP